MKQYISLAILIELMDGKRHTATEMAFKFETSIKTIYRAIDTLLQAGLPLLSFSGRDGGYSLLTNKNYDSSFFTTDELSSFVSFINSNPKHLLDIDKDNFNRRLSSLTNNKFINDLQYESQKLIIDTEIWGSNISQNEKLNTIKSSISNLNKCLIIYNNTQRLIHPYSLVFKAGIWYVYAYCEQKESFRLFKLSKIKNIEIKTNFTRRDISIESKPWNQDFINNSQTITLELIANNECFSDLTDWLGDQLNIIAKTQDTITIKATALYTFGLIHRLMQFGNKITILSPSTVQQDLKNECKKILNNY